MRAHVSVNMVQQPCERSRADRVVAKGCFRAPCFSHAAVDGCTPSCCVLMRVGASNHVVQQLRVSRDADRLAAK